MRLGDLIAVLERERPDLSVPHGFAEPCSWRGSYEQLAFIPAAGVTVASMLQNAKSAVGASFCGWKGGEYTMSVETSCWVARPDECGSELTDQWLSLSLHEATVLAERDAAIRERDEERKRSNEWLAQLHDSQKRVKVLERALVMVCRMVSLATDEDDVSIEFCDLCPALDGANCGKRCADALRDWSLAAAEKEGA